ncbi:MAG TPA: hypothetical protein VFQ80_19225, partial [Thermomicrobiales bacterium]|nr:hypothetical protein [Thermomicrobiales bacterium]
EVDAGSSPGDAASAPPAPPAHLQSLRDFVLANFPLLGAIGGLIGIATFVAALPLYADWVQPYLIFLLLGAGILVWLELLAQWPPELLIYRGPPPRGTPWRLVGFAYAVQLTMVGVVGGFFWHIPRLVVLALASVIGTANWRFLLPERIKERRGALLATAIAALLLAIAITSLAEPVCRSIFEVATLPRR